MKIIILTLSLLSLNAFADVEYRCEDVQYVDGWNRETILDISTGFFSGEINAVTLIGEKVEIRNNRKFEVTANPFTDKYAEYFKLDQSAVAEASVEKFKTVSFGGLTSKSITLSESLLNFESSGYAHYYSANTIWDDHVSSYYFKCNRK
jgi:hypothetical protein